jgi:hypothetical protein
MGAEIGGKLLVIHTQGVLHLMEEPGDGIGPGEPLRRLPWRWQTTSAQRWVRRPLGPSRTGQCLGSLGSDPLTGFRIGVDGATVPIPALTASATPPLIPGGASVAGANQPIANTTYQIDPTYKPGRNHEWDITFVGIRTRFAYKERRPDREPPWQMELDSRADEVPLGFRKIA